MKKGSKVKYIGCTKDQINWGGHNDPRKILNNNDTYIVSSIEERAWHTKVFLKGYKGHFNSVCFEEVVTT